MNARFFLFFLVLIGVGFSTPIQADESYVVRKGETLSTIAKKYDGVTWKRICQYNNLTNCDRIQVGEEIRIPSENVSKLEEVAIIVPLNVVLSESNSLSLKEEIPQEKNREMPATAEKTSPESIEDVFGSATTFNPEVKPDEISLDLEIFDKTQEVESQREEINALQKQVTEMEDKTDRMNSTIQLQREKISSYTLFIFLSVLGNIFLSLLLIKKFIIRKLRTRKTYFSEGRPK
ncbi:MAG: LysM domain-containing protein, partial [Candidatus Moranbacteria bacterium]|nr:LysM domain-containing protein [Candidatus Moranbacteria bacterium]